MDDIRTTFIELLDDAVSGPSFNNTDLMSTIKSLPYKDALKKGANGVTAYQVILHIAYWKHDIVKRLNAYEPKFLYESHFLDKNSDWPSLPENFCEIEWNKTIKYLDNLNRKLKGIIAIFDLRRLNEHVSGWNMTYKKIFTFLPSHDVYHTAQIRNMGVLQN